MILVFRMNECVRGNDFDGWLGALKAAVNFFVANHNTSYTQMAFTFVRQYEGAQDIVKEVKSTQTNC